jgi:ribosome-associated protein
LRFHLGVERPLDVRPDLRIPADELHESASRSSGPGGQHVNKTETRVTLRWNVRDSRALREEQRARLLARLSGRLTRRGHLVVHAQRTRSRAQNRELARQRLAELVRDALHAPAARVATRASRAQRERRLEAKRRRSAIKRARGRPGGDAP